jgi:hypothetical protein
MSLDIEAVVGIDFLRFGDNGAVLVPSDVSTEGSSGFSTLEFGSGGSLTYDQSIVGIDGFDVEVHFSSGEILIDPLIQGVEGIDFLVFGDDGRVRVPDYEFIGSEGISGLLIIGSGSISSDYPIRGSHGIASSIRFGVGGYLTTDHKIIVPLAEPHLIQPEDLVFRSSDRNLNSRYAAAQILEPLTSHSSFIAPWRMPRINPSPSDTLHTVTSGQEGRRDIISLVAYNRSDWWWILALANDIINFLEEPLAGDRIRVPSVQRIYKEVLGYAATGQELFLVRD